MMHWKAKGTKNFPSGPKQQQQVTHQDFAWRGSSSFMKFNFVMPCTRKYIFMNIGQHLVEKGKKVSKQGEMHYTPCVMCYEPIRALHFESNVCEPLERMHGRHHNKFVFHGKLFDRRIRRNLNSVIKSLSKANSRHRLEIQ